MYIPAYIYISSSLFNLSTISTPTSDAFCPSFSPGLVCVVSCYFLLLVLVLLTNLLPSSPKEKKMIYWPAACADDAYPASAFETANSAQRHEVSATAASQAGAGNDRVPPPPRSVRGDCGGSQGGDDDYDNDFNTVPLGGDSVVVPETHGPGNSWGVV